MNVSCQYSFCLGFFSGFKTHMNTVKPKNIWMLYINVVSLWKSKMAAFEQIQMALSYVSYEVKVATLVILATLQ